MGLLECQRGRVDALVLTALGARKAGQLMNSMAAIHEMHAMLQMLSSAHG